MIKRFTIFLVSTLFLSMGISSNLVAQISSYSVTTPLDKCQPATTAQLSIGATTATNLFITMPVGITYTAGSATCSGNPVAAPLEVVNGNGSITYNFTINNCVGTFIYSHSASCTVDETATLFDIAQLKNGLTLVGAPFQSLSYNVGEATPQVSSSSNFPASVNVLSSSTRTVNITNGGLGVTNDFYFEDIVPHNSLAFNLASVQLNGTAVPSGNISFISGATEDTLRVHFTSVQFATFGNNDNNFDGVRSPGPGQESFVLTYDQTANNCGVGNAIESELRTYYGCGSICSDVSILGSLGVNLSTPPILSAVYTMPAQSCYNYSTINTGTLTVTNNGGTAREVKIYFGDVWGLPSQWNYGLGATEMDTASVMLSINGGVAFHPSLIDVKFNGAHPYNFSATASCGTELKPCGAYVSIPFIASGQHIVITYQFKKCKVTITDCPSGNYKVTDTRINFSVYQLNYKNACLDASYGDGPNGYNYPSMTGYGQTLNYEYVWQTLNQEFPTDMIDQQIATFTTNFSDGSYDYLFQNNGYVQVTQSLPPGFTLASVPNNIEYIDGGGHSWAGTITNANPLEIRFPLPRPSGFDISSSKLNLQIQFKCAPYQAGPGSTPTVHQSWGVMTDPSCSSLMDLTCFDHTINLHCPGCGTEGINNVFFTMKRISLGAPDNDNDGIADLYGTINPALARVDRAMVGDTIELSYHGIVNNFGTPFTTGYAHSLFPQVNQWAVLPNSEAYLYRGGSLISSITNLTTLVNATDSLKTEISGLAPMLNADSIVVKVRMKLTYNTGGPLEPVVPDNIMYVTRPSAPSTWLYCDHWNGRITKVGWYHTYYYGQNPALTNCNANYIDITDYLSVGPCCNNYGNRSNIFPYEVKKYSYLDSVQFKVPTGLTLDHVDALFVRPGGVNTANYSSYTYTVNNVPTTLSGGFYKMGYKNYYADYGGDANNPVADDGWYVITRVYVKASCTTPTLTNMYLQCIEDIKSISPNVTDAHYELNYPTINNYPRFATYNGSQLAAVAGASASKNIAGDTVRWTNLILANQSTVGSNTNTWVYIQKPTSTTTIVSVTDNLGNPVPSANGFYQFGAMATSEQKIFNVIATTTSCNKDSVKVYYGYDCAGYPTAFSPNLCSYNPITLVARPLSAKIDGFVSALANTPADPSNPGAGNYGSSTIDMCTPFPVEMIINSALQGNIYDVNAKVQLPAGISYVPGSAYIEYPIGSTPRLIDAGQEAVLASVGAGGILNFKLDSIDGTNFKSIADKGLFGTSHSPSSDRQVKIRYKAQINCDYQGGGRLKMTMLAKRACGVNAINNGSVKTSSRLNLTAPPSVYQNTIVNSIPSFNSCADVLPATTTITKNGTNPIGAEDSILIEVPTGFLISTITCTGCPSSAVFPIVTSDGITDIYKWPYPAFTAPNYGNASPFTYSYTFAAPSFGVCAANLELTTSVIEKAGFTCNAVACPNNLPVEGGSVTSTFNYNKPTFDINPLSVVTYSTSLPYTYFINSTINNTSGVLANGFKLVYAYDVDNDSLYTAGTDLLIDAKSYSNTIAAGSNVVINESYTSAIDPASANFMVAILPLSSNPLEGSCACSEAYALAPISHQLPATLGNYVWYDDNNNGLQDEASSRGINGMIVSLFKDNGSGTFVQVATTSTANDGSGNPGYYNFGALLSGNYKVKFPLMTGGYTLTTPTLTAGTDGNSDVNQTTGFSPIVVIDVAGSGVNKDNPTIDAGFLCPGLAPTVSMISCHTNGTDATATDDYITFLFNPGNTSALAGSQYTLTATQNGNPIAVTLTDGTPATNLYFGYPSPIKTATGTAGQGNIIVTLTSVTTCPTSTTVTVTDPGICSSITPDCITTTQTFTYRIPFQTTDLNAVPLEIPKFNTLGGTRTLNQATLSYSIGVGSNIVSENSAATAANATIKSTGDGFIDLNGNTIFTNSFPDITSGVQNYSARVLVPANANGSSWQGDSVSGGSISTLARSMQLGLDNYLNSIFVDPSLSSAWVSNITGLSSYATDLKYMSGSSVINGTSTYNTPATLVPFIGAGLVNLSASTLTGLSVSGGGGNLSYYQRTKAYADVTVTYSYTTSCIPSVNSVLVVAGSCNGTTNQYDISGSVSFTNPPATGVLKVSVAGEGFQNIYPPFTSPMNYSITGLNSDGLAKTVTATFSIDANATSSATFTAPTTCLVSPCSATLLSETYHDSVLLQSTNWTLPLTIPKFNTMSGAKVLSKVVMSVKQSIRTVGVIESTDADTSTVDIQTTGTTLFKLNTDTIITNSLIANNTPQFLKAGILVPAQGSWLGDVSGSTLNRMATMVNNSINNNTDPRLDPTWVTNATGDTTTDDDIAVFSPVVSYYTQNFTFTNATDLAKFVGAGNLPITANAKANSTAVGPGNFNAILRTKASADVTITYIYCDCTSFITDAGLTQNLDCTTTSATIGTTAIAGNTYSWSPSTGLSATNIAQPTANPTTATTYTVTATNSIGCTATSSVLVNVNTTIPTADAGPTQNLNCTTTSATIGTSAISGNTYSWSPSTGLSATNIDQPTASPSATTTYTVTVTGANGCIATSTVDVNVDHATPSADAGTPLFLNCVTTSGMIGTPAISGITYSWSPSAGLSNATDAQPTASPNATTTYTVTAMASNGCTATSTVVVNVNGNIASIGNYVWEDLNHNGLNDEPASVGINGVYVELWNATTNTLVNSTTTGNDGSNNPGYYLFSTCISGDYFVKFPTTVNGLNLTTTTTTSTTDNNSDANPSTGNSPVFTIDVNGSGVAKDNTTIDAGYFTTACLGNYVWNDLNIDGVQNIGEVGVAGITVTLFNHLNAVVGTTLTDAYGYYQFCGLDADTYQVGFTLPANYVFTTSNQGSDDELDNDVNPLTGLTPLYTIVSGDSNMSIDAGIYFQQPTTASVGNYVWNDLNHDGIQDPGEKGFSGVTVSLYNNLGNVVATTITDANGFYEFTNVTPGTYTVGFTPLVGMIFSPNNGGVNDPSNSDANPSTGMTSTFTVNAGDKITYVDAGLYTQVPTNGSLGDKVWNDLNQNGVQDPSEPGVAGITVTLYAGDGTTVLATTTTNAFGNYVFNNLPTGQYVVGFSNLPVDYTLTSTAGTDSTTNSNANIATQKTDVINLGVGQNNMTIDAGIYTTSTTTTNSIGNYVWNDLNKNGIQDATEIGVPGITVKLYDNTNIIIATTSTDANGLYLFPDLPNGTYYVGFSNLPVGYIFSPTGQGTAATDNNADPATGLTTTITLTGNTHDMTLDAGINLGDTRIGLATLGDKVWYDINNDGLQDPNEGGVAGVNVTLYAQDGTTVIATTTTDALGNYIFTGLSAGNYVVGFENLPAGFTVSSKNSDGQGINGELNSDVNASTKKTDVIALGAGEDKMSVDMGIVPPVGTASLGNLVWIDLNHDGMQTSGEPGVQGVSVSLYDNTGNVLATTTTNADGEYYFIGLAPGTYSVGFNNLPSGYNFTIQNADASGINGASNSDANPTTGMTSTVTLAAGDNNLNLDAGLSSTTVASVGDYVWYDINQDGIQDANEPGIGGVLVTLYDNANNPVASAITNPDGSYLFTNVLPGTYTIGFSNIPIGMVFTTQETDPNSNTGSNVNPTTGTTPSFTVLAGTHNPTIDAGLTTPATAGLGNYVWLDVNEDGLQDAGEPGVAGVLVTLYAADGNTVIATTTTDGNGAYSFTNLPAGTYVVGFSNLPVGSTRTKEVGVLNDVNNSDLNLGGKTEPITLAANTYNPNIDAGIYYGVPLPVVLENFAATELACKVNLNWSTASEKNTSYFGIMRKAEHENSYHEIGRVDAIGNSSTHQEYKFLDANVENGIYAYQLKVVDLDNKASLSAVSSITLHCEVEDAIAVYPNPTNDVVNITIHSDASDTYQFEVTDMSGRVVLTREFEMDQATKTMVLNMNSFANGLYQLTVTNSVERKVFRIQKEN